MNEQCVVVFDDDIVPLRHVVFLKEEYHEEEFKRWYYGQYAKLDNDQFVHCTSKKARNDLLAKLNNSKVYHLVAPIWAEMEDAEGEIQDISAGMIHADEAPEKVMMNYVEQHPFDAKELQNEHVFHVYPRISKFLGVPHLDVLIWLNQDDIPEREWNGLFDRLSECLLNGWGHDIDEESFSDTQGNRLWLHFGEKEKDRIEFSVNE